MRRFILAIFVLLTVFILGVPAESHGEKVNSVLINNTITETPQRHHKEAIQLIEKTTEETRKNVMQEANEEATKKASEVAQEQFLVVTEQLQETVQKIVEENVVLEKITDNLSEWALAHDNIDVVMSIWKKTDKEGNLIIVFKNEQEEIIVAYKYEGIQSNYDEWVLCAEGITSQDICDYAFTAYHEVSGRNPKNVQAQICVLLNRQKCEKYFANTIRGVVTEPAQYSCAKSVVQRWLKSDSFLEKEDLDKCFQQTALVLAGELIQQVPENVLFAATGPQGSGVWQLIDGTYYCYI